MIKFIKVYNRDDYRKIKGVQSFATEVFEDYDFAEFVKKYFDKKFKIETFVVSTFVKDGYVVLIDDFEADRILSYYDRKTGYYTFGVETEPPDY